ncbi:protein of unknown function [Candidatus Promineifilum breve]|uniref:Uncharacterized protein n=1 Tax=Candidatus Promineifilum breve TaxID=1806508 RepID=A0A160T8W1_9CHLR|nr:hypothetical protein [Candidatus Promineifilum breve]CUS05420.2 protein of unknown function [Candidatus Promineifilum breve]
MKRRIDWIRGLVAAVLIVGSLGVALWTIAPVAGDSPAELPTATPPMVGTSDPSTPIAPYPPPVDPYPPPGDGYPAPYPGPVMFLPAVLEAYP